ncbi:FAD-dependent thymidylate synthase [Breznakiella homolactica]|uniref:Flavin-dependent thymidylate synthase n=1 Tax=Breznakiella homolactica TaxID=2798577 RepID=A0A7T8BAZ3_9SPIR|nr:FAD-dependent thymidylate synthase [Breznakiella homolactica]QQO09515.1 FAD-dependent thymidylate synthase [Breznakiella homolactica]
MAHCVVPEAEEILDQRFPVLDKGFIRLVDYLGSDERVVQSARVSYGSGTKSYREDAGLIDYLLRNRHTSPFEQVVLTFHVKLPIFVARQWIRHRTARLNEMSGRYSVMKDDFYVPAHEDVAFQSTDNKQGRSDEVLSGEVTGGIRSAFEKGQRNSYDDYSALIDQGLARELARINLPLSLYTEWYWQIDLHNLFHFLSLRLDSHAQKEIRLYAEVLLDITRKVAPRCCDSFERHMLGGVSFSREEFAELRRRLGDTPQNAEPAAVLEGKALERFEEKLRTGKQK